MTDKMNEIRALEDKYGLVLFRMALTHLVDVGHQNLTDENVEECVQQIMVQGEADKAGGKITIMTPEFQCEVLHCAAELTQFSIWELFAYIQKYVVISD
jgi:hypothetical protein